MKKIDWKSVRDKPAIIFEEKDDAKDTIIVCSETMGSVKSKAFRSYVKRNFPKINILESIDLSIRQFKHKKIKNITKRCETCNHFTRDHSTWKSRPCKVKGCDCEHYVRKSEDEL